MFFSQRTASGQLFGALVGDSAELARDLLQAALTLAVAWVIYRLLLLLARRIEHIAAGGDLAHPVEGAQRGRTLAGLVRSVGVAVIATITILLLLGLFIDVKPLLAGAGILTLTLSLGAQGLVKDVIAGFFILLEDQYRIGDVVRIGGVEGTVQRLTLRATVLRDGSGVVHFVPNGTVAVVSNLTRDWSRAVLDVRVALTTDVDRAMDALRAVVREFQNDPAWRATVVAEPTVAGLQDLSEGGMTIRLWVNVLPGRHSDAERDLRRRIKLRFDKDGIAFAVPLRAVRMEQAP